MVRLLTVIVLMVSFTVKMTSGQGKINCTVAIV